MSHLPLISVIIPVYNVERYLPECIDSVLGQTYKNLDVLLIDDGSTDNSPQICGGYAARDSRVRVIRKPYGGVSAARNTGLDNVTGGYLCFVDSDDWIAPDMIEYLYNNLVEHDADISCCGNYRSYVGLDLPRTCEKPVLLTNTEAVRRRFDGQFISSLCTRLYKKHIFDNIRFPDGKIYEDACAVFDFFMAAEKIFFGPEPKYYYRIRKSSLTHNLDFTSEVMGPLEMMEDRQKNVSERYPEFASTGEAYLFRRYLRALADICYNKDYYKTPEGKESVSQILGKLKENAGHLMQNDQLGREEKLLLHMLAINKNLFMAAQSYSAFRRRTKKQRRRRKEGVKNARKLVLFE